jgi:hypothetical protein
VYFTGWDLHCALRLIDDDVDDVVVLPEAQVAMFLHLDASSAV